MEDPKQPKKKVPEGGYRPKGQPIDFLLLKKIVESIIQEEDEDDDDD